MIGIGLAGGGWLICLCIYRAVWTLAVVVVLVGGRFVNLGSWNQIVTMRIVTRSSQMPRI